MSVSADLALVTYNVRAGIGPGPFPPRWWTRMDSGRLEKMAAFIVSVRADLVALQEVPLAAVGGEAIDHPALFARLLGFEQRYGAVAHKPLVEDDGTVVGAYLWGNVILSRFPILATSVVALPVTPNDEPAAPIDDEPRCAVVCRIDAPIGPLTFISTHLAYLGERARVPQARKLADIAASNGGPLVLAGDLNAPIESDELGSLTQVLDDAFATVGLAAGDKRRESCGIDRIDHVLTRAVEVLECRVAREAGDLSDHWPLIARLRVSDAAGSS